MKLAELLEEMARKNHGILSSIDAARTLLLEGRNSGRPENLRARISRSLRKNPSWKIIQPGTFALIE